MIYFRNGTSYDEGLYEIHIVSHGLSVYLINFTLDVIERSNQGQ